MNKLLMEALAKATSAKPVDPTPPPANPEPSAPPKVVQAEAKPARKQSLQEILANAAKQPIDDEVADIVQSVGKADDSSPALVVPDGVDDPLADLKSQLDAHYNPKPAAPTPVLKVVKDPWVAKPVAVSAPVAPKPAHVPDVKTLADRAVIVALRRGTYRGQFKDKEHTEKYGAGSVRKHLFADPTSRVRLANRASDALYNYIQSNTVPWMDSGYRLLNLSQNGGHNYMEFMSRFRALEDAFNASVQDLLAHWDFEVQKDYQRLQDIALAKGDPSLANLADYPSAHEIERRYYTELTIMPVPSVGDFRVGISDEDKAQLQKAIEDAVIDGERHVVETLVKEMSDSIGKLQNVKGAQGRFHDTVITNILEKAEAMERCNISENPALSANLAAIRQTVGQYDGKVDALRNDVAQRQKAANEIADLMKSMSGLI